MVDKDYPINECSVIHQDIVDKVSKEMLPDQEVFDLADFFKLFGDSTRLKILLALEKSEMCVCDIGSLLNMSMSAVSHQLKSLKDAKLIKSRRDGKVVYYSLDDEHVSQIMAVALTHSLEKERR